MPEFGARRGAIDRHRDLVGERVTDECRAHAVLAIEIRFEGEQAQHQVHRRADGAHAPLSPGPDLRAHVLHGSEARALELLGEPQVEFLVVDADEHVGPPFEDPPPQIGAQPHQARQVREHLGESHDRQLLDVVPGGATGGLHLGARDTREFGLRETGGAMPR